LKKEGEIIPKVVAVDRAKRTPNAEQVIFIEKCPECSTPLERKEGEAQHYCPNIDHCPPQLCGRIEHFISRKAMDLAGMGAETVQLLVNKEFIRNSADLYSLSFDRLIELEGFKEKSVQNILDGIQESKKIPFERVLFALGIRHVGSTVAKLLAKHFKSMYTLAQASIEEIVNVEGIGEVIAGEVYRFFREEKNAAILDALVEAGLQMEVQEDLISTVSSPITNAKIVVSGVFEHFKRSELKEVIEKHGAQNVSSISSKTSYIVAGEGMGPAKLKKAQSLGIRILSEQEFIALLGL
jgi:DNA ligase (NAD+)